jgi:hypothetical protein
MQIDSSRSACWWPRRQRTDPRHVLKLDLRERPGELRSQTRGPLAIGLHYQRETHPLLSTSYGLITTFALLSLASYPLEGLGEARRKLLQCLLGALPW